MYAKYKQLERDLLNAKMDLDMAEARLKKLIELSGPVDVKARNYENLPSMSSNKAPDSYQLMEIATTQRWILILKDYIKTLENIKKEFATSVEKYNKKFRDLEVQVFELHHIKHLPLKTISHELSYSYSHIKRINQGIIKIIKDDTKMSPRAKKAVL
jgi:DNA-directed RNA polymerase specialized sigma subunit